MSTETIGTIIAQLRRQKGSTQEGLAQAVGVSAQAVSKWERGGVPDVELLPAIADYFGVTVDALFGRQVLAEHLDEALAAKLIATPREEQLNVLFRLLWRAEKALFGIDPATDPERDATLEAIYQETAAKGGAHSCYLSDVGFTYMRLGMGMPYFFLTPETCLETEKLTEVDIKGLFAALAQEDVFNTFVFLYGRPQGKMFTIQLLINHLGLSHARAEEVLAILKKYGHVDIKTMELDDEDVTTYSFYPRPYFVAMLMLARECVTIPNHFWYYNGGRTTPYLTSK